MDHHALLTALKHRLDTLDGATVGRLLDAFAVMVGEQCAIGGRVALPDLGSWCGTLHREKVATDLTSGQRMLLPPEVEVQFQAAAHLRKTLKEGQR